MERILPVLFIILLCCSCTSRDISVSASATASVNVTINPTVEKNDSIANDEVLIIGIY